MFRAQMQVSPSNAEYEVLIELAKRDLLKHMNNLETIVLFMGADQVIIGSKETVTKQLISNCVQFTIPDFCFLRNHRFVVYLDGPAHRRAGIIAKDERIDRFCRSVGLEPLRFSYTVPLSKSRKNEIVDSIEAKLT